MAAAFAASLLVVPAAGALEGQGPLTAEPVFGSVPVTWPRGARSAELLVDGRPVGIARPPARGLRVPRPPGRYGLVIRYRGPGVHIVHRLGRVWLLPRSGRRARRERRRDLALSARLGALGREFDGWSGFWVHDLSTGAVAGWNSDAPFPAASLVKLGVLVAALDRWGTNPPAPIAKELLDLAVWSSNLASNRLVLRLGGGSERAGAEVVERTLHRLGAVSSTFTGFYRLGTSVARAADTPKPLPVLTYRRTTAHDVGRMLFELHAAALGNGLALGRTGLSRHEASVAVGLLLSSDSAGENLGLLRPAYGTALPMAQKQGWTTSLRHSAAIVYGPHGPRIVVLLTYRPHLRPAEALALGARLARTLGARGA